MRYQNWISQPSSSKKLRIILSMTAVAFIAGIGLAGAAEWSARGALSKEQGALARTAGELTQSSRSSSGLKATAARISGLRLNSPTGSGSADFAAEVAADGLATGVHFEGLEMTTTAGAQPSGPANAAPAAPGAAAPGGPNAPVAVSGSWAQQSFECRVSGRYAAIRRFLDRLTDAPRVIEYSSVQVMRTTVSGDATSDPLLELTVSGTVYGVPNAK